MGEYCLAMTHMDRAPSTRVCESYEKWDGDYSADSLSSVSPRYVESDILSVASDIAPVRFESHGAAANDKRECGVYA